MLSQYRGYLSGGIAAPSLRVSVQLPGIPKVAKLQVEVLVDQNIVGLDVPVRNVMTVHVRHCRDKLAEKVCGEGVRKNCEQ